MWHRKRSGSIVRSMRLSDFDYHLPKGFIAQDPLEKRDDSRLMFLNRETQSISHHQFYDLPHLLRPGDILVLNDSKVIPARVLFSWKGRKCEIFYLRDHENDRGFIQWEILVRPGKYFRIGDIVPLSAGFSLEIEKILSGKLSIASVKVANDLYEEGLDSEKILYKIGGQTPLPPYIHKPVSARRYQTIYARDPGSVAAPTAGLHFTKDLFRKLEQTDIMHEYITLHVGAGTFLPVKTENIEDHFIHSEPYFIDCCVIDDLNRAKKQGRRIIAVGTTVCRALETAADNESGYILPSEPETNIFIYPGYKFRYVDGLITNFHLPKSTLLMLVSAFAGREFIFGAYQEAIGQRYRFYSFGDAMLIV